jgi:hypothetical protein
VCTYGTSSAGSHTPLFFLLGTVEVLPTWFGIRNMVMFGDYPDYADHCDTKNPLYIVQDISVLTEVALCCLGIPFVGAGTYAEVVTCSRPPKLPSFSCFLHLARLF